MATKKHPKKKASTPSIRKVQRYGWVPDLPDPRDYSFAVKPDVARKMKPSVDLRKQCPPVYDQGQLGSCTANAIAGAIEFDRMRQKLKIWTPSRLFIYYNERVMEGTVNTDSGAQIRDGIKSVASVGDCPETDWPYDISQFAVRPPQPCFDEAVQYGVIQYQSVDQNLADMQGCLSSGFPFVFGFTVFPSFETPQVARTGNVPIPAPGEAPLGGHAVMAVGYDSAKNVFICRNSWGPSWGAAGYFYMPYSYLLDNNLSSDFWTIQTVQK